MKFALQTITGATLGCVLAIASTTWLGWQHNDVHFLVCIVVGVVITNLACWYWTGKTKLRAIPRPLPTIPSPTYKRSHRPYDNS